ncbi:NADH-quinone oxidoreductase subunit J [Deinococcus sp. Leaf326]|jgi:NADH-quinone oxidoreductase subunit J|uniref:NADH-quinone oxidoreductase subunit J family protein n=1 Tax=Deinococcus sp. Leaf326 TaxID=1736338 RepID=UPI000701F833|nr:NADH-quinone oxidoreductase subunit J [Deinococcus sp. Leaf326]KQR41080.1 NADH dehydrogenase [Deinococcus sp. Leaf326]
MMLAFILLGALTLVGGVITIAARNAVHAALGLVGTLLCVAGLFATLNASFLAATQVIVYAGAVMVLFLFVIMLLGATQPIKGRDPVPFVRELAGIGGTLLAGAFVVLAFSYRDPRPLAESAAALRGGAAGAVGETLLTRFLLPFEAVSILLLVAIVGSVALVQRPAPQPDPVPDASPAHPDFAEEVRA